MDTQRGATRSRLRRAAGAATTLVSVLLTLGALAFLAPSLLGLERYVITGTSMTGTIDRGALAFAEVVPVADLRVGDVITYRPPAGHGVNEMVTHRVVAITEDGIFRTKGDAVPRRDPWRFQLTAGEQARVVGAVPYVGYPMIHLADRGTRIVFIGAPAGIITLVSGAQVVRALRERASARRRAGRSSYRMAVQR